MIEKNEESDPLVMFQTNVFWSFAVAEPDQPQPTWGGDRYRSAFAPGERLLVPRSVGLARESAGLGKLIS